MDGDHLHEGKRTKPREHTSVTEKRLAGETRVGIENQEAADKR